MTHLKHQKLISLILQNLPLFPIYNLRQAHNRYIWLPLLRLILSADGEVPCDDLREILPGGQRMAKVPNGVETLPKVKSSQLRLNFKSFFQVIWRPSQARNTN